MKYVFDSSSIFRAILENRIELLINGYTDEIARYELGNILWKKFILKQEIDGDEYQKLLQVIYRIFKILETLNIQNAEVEVSKIASEYKITFYDASYVYHSKKIQIPLVTEDKRLRDKIKGYVKTLSINEI